MSVTVSMMIFSADFKLISLVAYISISLLFSFFLRSIINFYNSIMTFTNSLYSLEDYDIYIYSLNENIF